MLPRRLAVLCCLLVLGAATGCGERGPQMAPVKGKVVHKGQPLKFGGVIFQPLNKGAIAHGEIQPDGTFTLYTHVEGDGAIVGQHLVSVTCYEGQNSDTGGNPDKERTLGRLLIPEKFTNCESSGLKAEVKADTPNEFTFDLK